MDMFTASKTNMDKFADILVPPQVCCGDPIAFGGATGAHRTKTFQSTISRSFTSSREGGCFHPADEDVNAFPS